MRGVCEMHVASVIGQLKPTSLSIHNVTATPPPAALVVPSTPYYSTHQYNPNSALSISLDLHNTLYLHSLTSSHGEDVDHPRRDRRADRASHLVAARLRPALEERRARAAEALMR